MQNVVVAAHNGAAVFLRNLGDVVESEQQRLGKIGVDQDKDVVQGIVLLQRGGGRGGAQLLHAEASRLRAGTLRRLVH